MALDHVYANCEDINKFTEFYIKFSDENLNIKKQKANSIKQNKFDIKFLTLID